MASHLTSGRVNLGVLRESYRRELLECLDKCVGSKVRLMQTHCRCVPIVLAADSVTESDTSVCGGQRMQEIARNLRSLQFTVTWTVSSEVYMRQGCRKFDVPRQRCLCTSQPLSIGWAILGVDGSQRRGWGLSFLLCSFTRTHQVRVCVIVELKDSSGWQG